MVSANSIFIYTFVCRDCLYATFCSRLPYIQHSLGYLAALFGRGLFPSVSIILMLCIKQHFSTCKMCCLVTPLAYKELGTQLRAQFDLTSIPKPVRKLKFQLSLL